MLVYLVALSVLFYYSMYIHRNLNLKSVEILLNDVFDLFHLNSWCVCSTARLFYESHMYVYYISHYSYSILRQIADTLCFLYLSVRTESFFIAICCYISLAKFFFYCSFRHISYLVCWFLFNYLFFYFT